MPVILVGTVAEGGATNLGAYSLCFPYYVAGKDRYAMLLECRNSSNTAQNILRGSKVSTFARRCASASPATLPRIK